MKEQMVGGDHYARMGIDPITVAWKNRYDFLVGNIHKYVRRHRIKHGREDLEKARHFTRYRLHLIETERQVLLPAFNIVTMQDVGRTDQIITGEELQILELLHRWACWRFPAEHQTDEAVAALLDRQIAALSTQHYGAPK